ncbi:MAG: ATP-binding protein [Clostridiales bacterium]|nr:ATP-binding protein [Clostridiales bacterium]
MNTNIYEIIRREYEDKRRLAAKSLDERISEVYEKVPQMRELDREIRAMGIYFTRLALHGLSQDQVGILSQDQVGNRKDGTGTNGINADTSDTANTSDITETTNSVNTVNSNTDALDELEAKRRNLLTAAGFPQDYFELHYECPNCKDTGYISIASELTYPAGRFLSSESKPKGSQPMESKLMESNPIESRLLESRLIESGTKKSGTIKFDTIESKLIGSISIKSKPMEPKPIESGTLESKAMEPKHIESKPVTSESKTYSTRLSGKPDKKGTSTEMNIKSNSGSVQEKCHCYRQRLVTLACENIGTFLPHDENFQYFDESYYSKDISERKFGITISPRENIQIIKSRCEEFINNFISTTQKSLFFSGSAGTGKTFMAHSIAYELINIGYTVLYQSAPLLFTAISTYRTSPSPSFSGVREDSHIAEIFRSIYEVDLLIIDDLGTEPPSDSRYAELLNLLNGRHAENARRPCKTIISTNLSPKKLQEYYTDRVVSRIVGNFDRFIFAGDDIRLLKSRI